ncbi:MAG: hypothetical protein F4018_19365 [Acidobacteria bacterium]|nr:hypothetical protein [Acidobacteriota bacterium]MYK90324.1 hypothetical protein [Acidobacteriota bacterium]
MWRAALIVLLVAYLPGAVLFRCPLSRRALRAGLPAEERLFWAVIISVALSTFTALLLAAAGSYSIERLLWLNGLVALGAAAAARGDLRLGAAAPPPTRTAALPIALLLAAAGMFFLVPPAEYVMGGRDPGVYINEGIQITQRGSLTTDDRVVRSVPPEHRPLFFAPPRRPPYDPTAPVGYESLRFMGFFNVDAAAGTVVGQFPHAYPAWVAIAYDAAGLTGARYAAGLWGLLGVLAVYFAGVRWLGRPAAVAGAALLSLHVAQVWYARFPNADIVMQALVWTGLLAQSRAQADDDRFFAPLAGGLLGLSVFAHFTGVLAIGAAGVAAVLGRSAGQRPRAAFLLPLIALTAAAAVYYLVVLTPYSARPILYVRGLTPVHLALLAAGGLATAALAAAAGRAGIAGQVRTWLPRLLPAAIWILAAYALFFREAGGSLAPHDADALRTYTDYYLGPLGLAAALAGLAVVSTQRFWRGVPFLIVWTTFFLFFFYKLRVVPEHFWMARRFVPVILPASLLLIGAAAFTPLRWPEAIRFPWTASWPADRLRAAAGAALVAWLGWGYLDGVRPILRHVELAGLIPQVEEIAARLAPTDLLLVESRAASDLHVLATPLAYIHDRDVLTLHETAPDKAAFRDFLEWARSRYARVLFMGGGGTDLLSRDTTPHGIWGDRFQIPQYEQSRNAYPTTVRRKEFDYTIYDLLPVPVRPGPFSLDVGDDDDLYVRRIHAKQRDQHGVTYRWTRDRSFVSVIGTLPDARELTLYLSDGGRPADASPARVRLTLDDRPLGALTVSGGFRPYRIAIPADLAPAIAAREESAALRIEASTWNPHAALGVPDNRDLGVMVDRIEIR